MVQTWNTEPSKEQNRSPVNFHPVSGRKTQFLNGVRFAKDGAGANRIANFTTTADFDRTEANALASSSSDLSAAGLLADTLARQMATGINAVSIMRSTRPRSATNKSYLANDPRFSHLHEAYEGGPNAFLGPGSYDLSLGSPSLGLLPLDHPTAGATPLRDPFRMSKSFCSPQRPLSPYAGVHAWDGYGQGSNQFYIDPTFRPASPRAAPWSDDPLDRMPASDWRFGGRIKDAKRDLTPLPDAPPSPDPRTDSACRPVEVAVQAQMRNTAAHAFQSRELRTVPLPVSRSNDVRTQRSMQALEDSAHLGPGSHQPLTSVGGPKRATYRIFVDPFTPVPQSPSGLTPRSGAVSSRASPRQQLNPPYRASSAPRTSRPSTGSLLQYNAGRAKGSKSPAATSSFNTPFRSAKWGPHSWATDSSLSCKR